MERQITPFAPGKIFPPLPRDATPFTPAAMPAVFGLRSGGAVFLGGLFVALLGAMIIGSAAFLVVNACGAPDGVGLQCAAAFGLFGGSALSLAWTLQRVRSRFPRTLTDRSVLGCAWFGAPDEVVVTAYLGGGLINLIGLLGMPIAVMTDVDMSSPLTPFAHWHAVPMMVFAFALIAARPVLEELLFRGVLFAALRQRLTTLAAAILVSTLFALAHYAQLVVYPPAVLWIGAMGVLAMHLRLKHASLAPAIALHSGFNFMPVVFTVLN